MGKAKRGARIFLAHVAPVRKCFAVWSRGTEERGEQDAARWRAAYASVEAAAQAVEAALPVLSEKMPPEYDPIRIIAENAYVAWQRANDGDAPRGKNPDDPLVKFVVKAFAAIDISHSAEAVSAILRGRRRTNRKRKDKTSH